MHLVILAAGEWSRLRPLTNTVPKPLTKLCGKSILEHNLESVYDVIDEIYMVVRYKRHIIEQYFWEAYRGKKIHYIEQIEKNGTGAAILSLNNVIDGPFVVISWDDLYEKSDLLKLFQTDIYTALYRAVDKPENFGIFVTNEDGKVVRLVEKPKNPSLGNKANIGVYRFDSEIFKELTTIPYSPRWELEITDLIDRYIGRGNFQVIEAEWQWITIGYPWDLLKYNEQVLPGMKESKIDWEIEENVTIKWMLHLGKWSVIKAGSYIEWNVWIGENVTIWPNAYVRGNTSIWKDSKVGSFVELKNSYIGEHTFVPHLSYVGDSVIGNNSNLWAGVKIANLRHDGENVQCVIKEEFVDSGRKKLGAIIGDNVKLWIDTLIYPGRILDTGKTSLPGEVIIK
jgi:bifunctional UDP-N-acetylglucosamine pyrophosphorylase/glucosamine-1-phosphate N-acetyltransferase